MTKYPQTTVPNNPQNHHLSRPKSSHHATTPPPKPVSPRPTRTFQDDISQVYAALTLGTRDYIHKTGFQKVAIALSGGIDSSIVACIAADAIGPENIVGVGMPSRYSSEGSLIDAQDLADRLKIPLWRIPIEPAHAAFEQMLAETFHGHEANTAEENVQSRIRGNVMMTIANKFGWLVLTTGNKSEMATGYATLYGDMAGGFAVIKDIPKQLVYQLSAYRNGIDDSPPIPQSVIDKPPTAELRPDQLDVDSLPPYDQLDPVAPSVHRRTPLQRRDSRRARRRRPRHGGPHPPHGRHQRIQTTTISPRRQSDRPRLRTRPPHAHSLPLAPLTN